MGREEQIGRSKNVKYKSEKAVELWHDSGDLDGVVNVSAVLLQT